MWDVRLQHDSSTHKNETRQRSELMVYLVMQDNSSQSEIKRAWRIIEKHHLAKVRSIDNLYGTV